MTLYSLAASRQLNCRELEEAVRSTDHFRNNAPLIVCGQEQEYYDHPLMADWDIGVFWFLLPGEFPCVLEFYTPINWTEGEWAVWAHDFCKHCGISALISDAHIDPYTYVLIDGVNADSPVEIDIDFHDETGGYTIWRTEPS
jgi:hypothetical protein